MNSSSKIFYVLLLFNIFTPLRSDAQYLPESEVQALTAISIKLKNKYWNISNTSCTVGVDFNMTIAPTILSNVTCDCSYNHSNVCHVTNIQLKGLNLTGVLPTEFANLPYLREIDLSRNYVGGAIPTSLAKLPLVVLSLLGNRISGSIPEELGDVATLEELVLESNQLGGPLPRSLGKLGRLRRVLLSANNFKGTIPETYGNLKNLTDFMIDGNSLTGKIPTFIGNWTRINRLDMQGTGLESPIPSTLSLLENVRELRISDLNGSSIPFPNLQNMEKLKILVLRNCLITGPIPDYINKITGFKTLDLSFNKLTGQIPGPIDSSGLNYIFLNNNLLSGEVPNWVLESIMNIDISYNNFTGPTPLSCQQTEVNVVSSYSSVTSEKSDNFCWKKELPCSEKPEYHSLFINCGGNSMTFKGNEYLDDSTPGGASRFYSPSEEWAYSTTGLFTDNDKANFKTETTSPLNGTDAEFYRTARLAPISVKYYGLCLRKGSYRVQLHFAEIMFTDDQTFGSVGRRIFDVSIQGNVVLKDFNIMKEAKAIGKGITKDFKRVFVNGSTLEIHLYWAGKGTTYVPDRGVYGPLISAITVTPNFDTHTGLSREIIAGIAVASSVVVVLILVALRRKGYLGGKDRPNKELRDLQTGYFSLRQIKTATRNFDPENKIGEGGFGPVYKGVLSDGSVIAVKQLSAKSKQGNREFVNEIGMISALQHPNLVKLYGCCIEANQLLLVYEYMENNSLASALFGRKDNSVHLDWKTRNKICLGIARGLAYLHEESRLKIVHRDIKLTNVLLDKDLNAKISDFGLAKLDEEEKTHISTRIAGTIGYMAPEYAIRGYLTDKADVYSFGIVALEIVSGISNTNYRPKEEFVYLLDWAYVLQEQGNLLELVDPSLSSSYSKKEALRMLNLALWCANPSPTLRPPMSSVVSMLEGKTPVNAPAIKRASARDEMRFRAFEEISYASQTMSLNSDVMRSGSVGHSQTEYSMSLQSIEGAQSPSAIVLLPKDRSDIIEENGV